MNKNKLTLLLISFQIILLFVSCSTDNDLANNESKNPIAELTSSFNNNTSDTQVKDSTSIEFNNQTAEFKILDLGKQNGNKLKYLFLNFLNFDDLNLIITINFNNIKNGIIHDEFQGDLLLPFNRVEDAKYKTYSDLYDYFCSLCTSEYSTELLTQTTHMYEDIDDELYIFCGEDGFTGYTYSSIDSYEIVDDTIIYTCAALCDDSLREDYDSDNPIHDPQYDKKFTLTIKQIDGEWYLDSCSDIYTLANTWYMEDN